MVFHWRQKVKEWEEIRMTQRLVTRTRKQVVGPCTWGGRGLEKEKVVEGVKALVQGCYSEVFRYVAHRT